MDTPIQVDLGRIAQDLQIRRVQVESVVQLLDEGNTVPFITRYRKERTSGLNEVAIREIQIRVGRLRELAERKETILKAIEAQGKLTDELAAAIRAADNPKRLEDLYLPYKPKKKTKASEAREKGLEPLALRIWTRDETLTDLAAAAVEFVDAEKGVESAEKALEGVGHILAEAISEMATVREAVRRTVWKTGKIVTSKGEIPEGQGLEYRDYFNYSEPVSHIPPHRVLAINRGDKEGPLKVKLEVPRPEVEAATFGQLPLEGHPHSDFFRAAAADALDRLLLPSLEREVRRDLTELAERHAVEVFARNLRSLLLQPPISKQVVLAIDPGFRTGCKVAVLDGHGNVLEHGVVHPHQPQNRRHEAKMFLKDLVGKHGVDVVAIGNGTACRETEELIAEIIAEGTHFAQNPGVPFNQANAGTSESPATAGDPVESSELSELAAAGEPSDENGSDGHPTHGRPEPASVAAEPDAEAASTDPEQPPSISGGAPDDPPADPATHPEGADPGVGEPQGEHGHQPPPSSMGESETPEGEAHKADVLEKSDQTRNPANEGEASTADAAADPAPAIEPEPEPAEAAPPSGLTPDLLAGSEADAPEPAPSPEQDAVVAAEATPAAEAEATSAEPAVAEATPPQPPRPPKAKGEPRPPRPKPGPPPPPAPHAADGQLAQLSYVIVNEAGASVYSTSPVGREEFPDYDPTLRSTISIGRRLQDPLSELVKIEPQNIGVGLYQHDVNPKQLKESLEAVIASCVNFVGVDLNTASVPLLRHVSGLNQLTARRVVDFRKEKGPFARREQLQEVEGVGPITFTQAAGFLKVPGGEHPLDRTWVHPESYGVAQKLLERLGFGPEVILDRDRLPELHAKLAELDIPAVAKELEVGEPTLADIAEALARPDRDPREDLPKPIFKKGVLKLEDLSAGMELKGTVLNVVDFGAFVDIGLKDSGLVHISQLANRYIKSPHDVVSVGDVVTVWVMGVDQERKRVSLTMVKPGTERPRGSERGPAGRPAQGRGEPRGDRRGPGQGQGRGPRPPASNLPPQPVGTAASAEGEGGAPPSDRYQRGGPGRGGPGGPGRGGYGGGPRTGGYGGPGRAGPGGPRTGQGTGSGARFERAQAPRPQPKPSRPAPPPPPLSKEAITGSVPLRSFGQLKQLFDARSEGPTDDQSSPPPSGPDQGRSADAPPPAESSSQAVPPPDRQGPAQAEPNPDPQSTTPQQGY